MDAALHKAGVTLVLDRPGIDLMVHTACGLIASQFIPGLTWQPLRDAATLREALLREAVVIDDAPTVAGYPKGSVVKISLPWNAA